MECEAGRSGNYVMLWRFEWRDVVERRKMMSSVDLRVCCGCVMWKVIVMWFWGHPVIVLLCVCVYGEGWRSMYECVEVLLSMFENMSGHSMSLLAHVIIVSIQRLQRKKLQWLQQRTILKHCSEVFGRGGDVGGAWDWPGECCVTARVYCITRVYWGILYYKGILYYMYICEQCKRVLLHVYVYVCMYMCTHTVSVQHPCGGLILEQCFWRFDRTFQWVSAIWHLQEVTCGVLCGQLNSHCGEITHNYVFVTTTPGHQPCIVLSGVCFSSHNQMAVHTPSCTCKVSWYWFIAITTVYFHTDYIQCSFSLQSMYTHLGT